MAIGYQDGVPSQGLLLLQARQKQILGEVLRFCHDHHLRPFLVGGSALGSIRHGDIIPWDDDIDIGLIRDEFDQFALKFESQMGQHLRFETALEVDDYVLPFGKVRDRSAHMVTPNSDAVDTSDGVFIDVFPFDYRPTSRTARAIQVWILLALDLLIVSRPGITPSKERWARAARRAACWARPWIPTKRLKVLRDTVSRAGGLEKGEQLVSFGYFGMRHWRLALCEESDVFPTRSGRFGQLEVPLPRNVEALLEQQYGDYLELPRPSDRHPSHAVGVSFDYGTPS